MEPLQAIFLGCLVGKISSSNGELLEKSNNDKLLTFINSDRMAYQIVKLLQLLINGLPTFIAASLPNRKNNQHQRDYHRGYHSWQTQELFLLRAYKALINHLLK